MSPEQYCGGGHNQLAYLVKLGPDRYLCIGGFNLRSSDTMYVVGEVTENLPDYAVLPSKYKIEDSPLYGSFLFGFFLSNQDRVCPKGLLDEEALVGLLKANLSVEFDTEDSTGAVNLKVCYKDKTLTSSFFYLPFTEGH